jgi:hypothetical protein
MRTLHRNLAVAAFLAGALCVPVRAQALSLAGVLARGNPASPVAGTRVYLRQGATDIGPSITDAYGRYAFYETAPGTYQLRVQIGGHTVLSRTVTVPGRIPPLVL